MRRTGLACLARARRYARLRKDDDGDDTLLWSQSIGNHAAGEFSMAVVQANDSIEDRSQVEIGRSAIFFGVYDGHGGADAAQFISDNLFAHLIGSRYCVGDMCDRMWVHNIFFLPDYKLALKLVLCWQRSSDPPCALAQGRGAISEAIIRNAFAATEDGFLELVRTTREASPSIAAVGSCCLVGLIWDGKLYVANCGDSRAVLGRYLGTSTDLIAEQLTSDHNASMVEVRQELRSHHPDDPQIVVMKHGSWRVKGIIQVSRSIGDAYLKLPEFTADPSLPRFELSEPLLHPVLSAAPAIDTRVLSQRDKFVIFASDGLWEHLSNEEAVAIVKKHPRAGIARRLIRAALDVAAKKGKLRYSQLKKLGKGVRRYFHDDISVIVVFIDHQLLSKPNTSVQEISVRSFIDVPGTSDFSAFDDGGSNAAGSAAH
ncbi:putative protein phosphatase 2C 25 [Platanthera zijinensis]|uniref:protein-serine/threonine phosphatase n=1 Tax=Platanthera zijinensis TaxID=2320716 RepID=A0AAP0BX31_9ASPA